jgi:hypothetical protein
MVRLSCACAPPESDTAGVLLSFWFSNGCAIGCEACDGDTRGPIPKFDCASGQTDKSKCDLTPDPNNPHMQFGPKVSCRP